MDKPAKLAQKVMDLEAKVRQLKLPPLSST